VPAAPSQELLLAQQQAQQAAISTSNMQRQAEASLRHVEHVRALEEQALHCSRQVRRLAAQRAAQ